MDLFLSPHNDDETLFGSFTIIGHRPHVVVCFKSQVQEDRGGPTAAVREGETNRALWWLGAQSWEQLTTLDTDPEPETKLYDDLVKLRERHDPEIVWAPYREMGAHEQHNTVARVALEVFEHRCRWYCTYVRGYGSTKRVEVPFTAFWVATKMRAMACYASQIALENTQFWFMDDTMREYTP